MPAMVDANNTRLDWQPPLSQSISPVPPSPSATNTDLRPLTPSGPRLSWKAFQDELISFLDSKSSRIRLSFTLPASPDAKTFFLSPTSSTSSLSDASVVTSAMTTTTGVSGAVHSHSTNAGHRTHANHYQVHPPQHLINTKNPHRRRQQPRYESPITPLQRPISTDSHHQTLPSFWHELDELNAGSNPAAPTSSGTNTPGSWTRTARTSPLASPSGAGFCISAQPTRQEFESLPPTIQRKFFSTLERLRFAETSACSPATVDADLHALAAQDLKRRRSREGRLASDHFGERLRRRSSRRNRATSTDSLFYANLPDKIKRRHLTAEEQIIVARCAQRKSIILDSADEVIYGVGRRGSRHLTPDDFGVSTLSKSQSMESCESAKRGPEGDKVTTDSFYDSFRWLEEDDDLDLRLVLDDYHATIREDLPPPTKQRRPSFRRHISITKLPFGRTSVSSGRPATKDTSTPVSPLFAPSPVTNPSAHNRRKSRTMSLIAPKQSMQEDTTAAAIDPAAAHYQDPEARLKLRVYLASPQKFDEAIEFGFPAKEAMASSGPAEAPPAKRRQSRQGLFDDERLQTFLSDDKSSVYSDELSVADPDSPKTPNPGERPMAQPLRVGTDSNLDLNLTYPSKMPTDYAQAPASSREMTLRMTLTRPDLRACEDQIYGWQKKFQAGRSLTSQSARDETMTPVTYIRNGNSKDSMERHFAALDRCNTQPEQGRGRVKRFWNKMRGGPS